MPTITETVREIALNQPSSIRVFEQFGIDYCCGGRKPLAIACTELDVEIDAVLTALANAASEPSPELTNWSKRRRLKTWPATSSRSTTSMLRRSFHAWTRWQKKSLERMAPITRSYRRFNLHCRRWIRS